MADVGQVHANLMRPAGEELGTNQIAGGVSSHRLNCGSGWPAGLRHPHPSAVPSAPGTGLTDLLLRLQMSPDQCRVLALDPVQAEGVSQFAVGLVGLRHDDK